MGQPRFEPVCSGCPFQSGSLSGIDAPFEFATELEFNEDGTLEVTVNDKTSTYKYSATDDTITVQGDDMSWGMYYTANGTTLSLKTGSEFSTFTKSK